MKCLEVSGAVQPMHGSLGVKRLRWADQVNYTVKKAWKALHFTMRILKKGNSNTESLA